MTVEMEIDTNAKLRTIWCGNLSSRVTEELLYELFLQGGPLESVSIPKDRDGTNRGYAFVTYKHQCSVPYAVKLFEGTSLFDKALRVSAREAMKLSNATNNQQHFKNNLIDNHAMNNPVMYNTPPPPPVPFVPQLNFNHTGQSSIPPLFPAPLLQCVSHLVQASLRGQWNYNSNNAYNDKKSKNNHNRNNHRNNSSHDKHRNSKDHQRHDDRRNNSKHRRR